MALLYPPKVGEIFICAYPDCFGAPEMVKERPVVVINPRLDGRLGLVTVVPLSTTAPNPIRPYHIRIPARLMPKCFQAKATECWAKCDMVYTFALHRLSLVEGRRDRKTGKRSYDYARLDLDHIQQVRLGICSALGITNVLFPALAAANDPVDVAESEITPG